MVHFWFKVHYGFLQVLFVVVNKETDRDFEERRVVMKFHVKAGKKLRNNGNDEIC